MYTLRPARADDFDRLYALHDAAMHHYVEATWGWDDAFQRAAFTKSYDPGALSIIVVVGEDAGVMAVERRDDLVYLRLIEIDPRWQRRGVGGAIVTDLKAEAFARGVPFGLRVLKVNPGARRLYERHGFVVVATTETHYDMRCSDAPPHR